MTEVKLSVDVMCNWLGYNPAYRIYVDGDLITERTYRWNNDHEFVREHILVYLNAGTHTLKLEKVRNRDSLSDFDLKNFAINDQPAELVKNTFVI